MPMKWCPKCKTLKEKVNRVFSIVATWDDDEDDYRYGKDDELDSELIDKCLECGTELEEMPCAKGAEGKAWVEANFNKEKIIKKYTDFFEGLGV